MDQPIIGGFRIVNSRGKGVIRGKAVIQGKNTLPREPGQSGGDCAMRCRRAANIAATVKIHHRASLAADLPGNQPLAADVSCIYPLNGQVANIQEAEVRGRIEQKPRSPDDGIKVLARPALDHTPDQARDESGSKAGFQGNRHVRSIPDFLRLIFNFAALDIPAKDSVLALSRERGLLLQDDQVA